MAYDHEFYQRYRAYLQESTVRTNHDMVFEDFVRFANSTVPLRVVDLGCGLGEYHRYGHWGEYVGVDINEAGNIGRVVLHDYHDFDFVRLLGFAPTSFVSLFSIECYHSAVDKYSLYERIFSSIPSIQHGLVGGFFYESKRNIETVGETGGIISHQTIEDPSRHICKAFSEYRIHTHTPSKMFGDDVIEVWKVLTRR